MTDNTQLNQTILKTLWRDRFERGLPTLPFDEVQFRQCSQNGEDGILLYLFTLLGTTNKKFLEICAGDGQQCNTANLVINHGWKGLMLDGKEENIKSGRAFYAKHPDTLIWPPKFVHSWITRDNINDLVMLNGMSGDIDLLSIDLDGNDYWIFEALDVVNPRIIVTEYQAAFGADSAITQRYIEDFRITDSARAGMPRVGASLPALAKLAKKKGYRLVGCERLCFNAFFVREDIGQDVFPEVELSTCFLHQMAQYRRHILEQNIAELDREFWIEV